MNLSEKTSEVVGFDSTWDEDKEVFVKDTGTEVMENQLEVSDKNIGTKETKEMGVRNDLFSIIYDNYNKKLYFRFKRQRSYLAIQMKKSIRNLLHG